LQFTDRKFGVGLLLTKQRQKPEEHYKDANSTTHNDDSLSKEVQHCINLHPKSAGIYISAHGLRKTYYLKGEKTK